MSQSASVVSVVEEIRINLNRMGDQFGAVLPTKEHVDRFIRVVMTAVQKDRSIAEADRTSFYAACMNCATDGLMPDGKEAVLNVYNTNIGSKDKPEWKKIVQYQPMVEGMMKKLRLSEEIKGAPKIHVVKANDQFTYELGDAERIIHKPVLGDRGTVVAAYSIVEFKDGGVSREVMSASDIEAIRARSKTPNSGPWKTDYDEMCRKTVFRRHSKRLPKSTDLDNVLKSDDDTFIPYEDRDPGPPAQQQAGQGQAASPATAARPKALEHVVNQAPPAPKPAQREPITVEGAATKETGEHQDPLPTDII